MDLISVVCCFLCPILFLVFSAFMFTLLLYFRTRTSLQTFFPTATNISSCKCRLESLENLAVKALSPAVKAKVEACRRASSHWSWIEAFSGTKSFVDIRLQSPGPESCWRLITNVPSQKLRRRLYNQQRRRILAGLRRQAKQYEAWVGFFNCFLFLFHGMVFLLSSNALG